MDELINLLKSDKKLDEEKLKEIKEILVNRSMYEWYVDADGNEPLEDYFKILEELGKTYFIEELVSTRCEHVFLWNQDENKYQCIRCGFRSLQEPLPERLLQLDCVDYYKACKLYKKIIENRLTSINYDEVIQKMIEMNRTQSNRL